MQRVVSLTTLLNGNSKKPRTESPLNNDSMILKKTETQKYDEDSSMIENNYEHSMEIFDNTTSSTGVSSQPWPEKEHQSVQSLLMSQRNKKMETQFEEQEDTVIISSDNEQSQNDTFVLDLDDQNEHSSFQLGNRVSYPVNSKVTKLKDLFKGLKQDIIKPIEFKAATVTHSFNEETSLPRRRKLKPKNPRDGSFPAPFPRQQLIRPDQEDFRPRKLNIPLIKKSEYSDSHPTEFSPSEYEQINGSNKHSNLVYTRISTANTNRNILWTQLLKPQCIEDILLDPLVKNNVNDWILGAFEKLKRHTTRNKLVKRQKVEDRGRLDNFIVNDEFLNEEPLIMEFVPVMILFGKGIGKNTLIEVIMKALGGQIYEINASSNRSKREILDSLTEFSTTHYVKGKGSKGIILFDDVDVLFKEHDRFFWQAVEKILIGSRRPIVLLCRDVNFIPSNIVQLADEEGALFHAQAVSHRTVTKFMERYCQVLGLNINKAILELLVKCNNNDIRKSLMHLQFACTSPGNFPIETPNVEEEIKDKTEIARYTDIKSMSSILQNKTEWSSVVLQDDDPTLMSPEVHEKYNQLNDDQQKLLYDYMVDYRTHLLDKINRRALPFELNVGSVLDKELKRTYPNFKSHGDKPEMKFDKITRATIAYLSSRVDSNKNSMETQVRRTRNSRKYQEILDRFNGKFKSEDTDENIEFDFGIGLRKNIGEQVNPYVNEIAKAEALVREENREVFLKQVKGTSKDQHCEIVYHLLTQGLIKPYQFKSDPKVILDLWHVMQRSCKSKKIIDIAYLHNDRP